MIRFPVQRRWWVMVVLYLAAAASSRGAVVKFEAEAGVLGAGWTNGVEGVIQFISTATNAAGNYPSDDFRVATYTVNFPAAGTYDLFVRLRVGVAGASDDSFFYGNGLGVKSPATDADWILCNNLGNVGYTNSSDVVSGGGAVGSQTWKWINVSEFNGGEVPTVFTVPADGLTQTFQIASREDGLGIDALVFGSTDYLFTVANLDAGAEGLPPTMAMCTVNWTNLFQRIDGFGASSAWRSTWNATVADRYFSTNTGLGLSLLRTRIAPGGTTVESSIMQMAQARGARVWSAPWTPAPVAQFKSNTNLNGGNFIGNASNYQAYASQLANYVVAMKNQYGVNLYALSIQNEPDANVTNYESCKWTSQQIHDFVPYLSSTLAASNVGATKIMLPESQNWTDPQGLRLTTMNDATTAALVGIIANHNYVPDNNNGDQSTPAAINNYGKALWETEVSTFSAYDSSITNGIYWARRLHQFLTVAQVNAWHYWWFNASDNSGIADSGDNLAKRGYVLGQFSRFVRPDFYRIGVVTNFGTALASAYRDTNSGRFAIVAVNRDLANVVNLTVNLTNLTTNVVTAVTPWVTSRTVSLAGQSPVGVTNSTFTYALPALSVVTFVGQTTTNSAPMFAAVANQITNAGAMVNITNAASDPNLPAQTLTFSLLGGPANSTLNSSNGVFSWRPSLNQADSTNAIAVKVADNGTPSLSATNSFTITIRPLVQPSFSAIQVVGGQISLAVTGVLGPDYTLLVSTNLTNWQSIGMTNPVLMPFEFIDASDIEPVRFYRLQLGP